MRQDARDPYAPPRRHRDSSGALVRFTILAALLGATAWGYAQYAVEPHPTLLRPVAEDQTVAAAYETTPSLDAAEPAESAPAQQPAAPEGPPA